MNKFLILGTGADINKIDFNKISDEFIIAGVNRIYEKIIPDYYFVYDLNILAPIIPDDIKIIFTHPDKLAEYFRDNRNYKQNFCTFYDKDYTPEFTFNGNTYDCGHGSVSYMIRALNNYLYENEENVFYIAGVPLLESVGHFYDDEKTTSIQMVLDRFYNDFIRLKSLNYNIISLMDNSRLNALFPKEKINVIYGDRYAIS